tara:strand:- start:252 stop:494 length:243 start_codon:yes stop_codon:yes gene_type:complete
MIKLKDIIEQKKALQEMGIAEAPPKMKKNPNAKAIQNVFSQTLNLKKGGMQSRYSREFESARKRALKALRDMEKFSKIGV